MFAWPIQAESQRKLIRESMIKIVNAVGTDKLSQSSEFVHHVDELFPMAFLQLVAKVNDLYKGTESKRDLIAILLDNYWIPPSDEEVKALVSQSFKVLQEKKPLTTLKFLNCQSSSSTSSSSAALLRSSMATSSSNLRSALEVDRSLERSILDGGIAHSRADSSPETWLRQLEAEGSMSAFEVILKSLKAQALINQRLAKQGELEGEGAGMTKQAKQAIKKGEWIPITCMFDEDIAKLRCSMAFSWREYKRPRQGDDMDFNDYLICLAKLSVAYAEAGHANLAIQTTKLMQAAIVESASKTKVSVSACERLRKQSTSVNVNWDSDSLGRHDIRVLLEDVQRKDRPRSETGNRKRKFHTQQQSRFSNPPQKTGSQVGTSQVGVCMHWEAGKICPWEPSCKFRHYCSACGRTEVHDPQGCKLRTATRRQRS